MKTKPKLTFGRVRQDWMGWECAVFVDGSHEITLTKAPDGEFAEWYTRGLHPDTDKPSAWFKDIDHFDGVDLGRTLREAKAGLRRYYFAPEGIDDDDLAQWQLEQPGAVRSGNL